MEESTIMQFLTNLDNKIDGIKDDLSGVKDDVSDVKADVKVLQIQVKQMQDNSLSLGTIGRGFRWLWTKNAVPMWLVLVPLVNYILSLCGLPSIPILDALSTWFKT